MKKYSDWKELKRIYCLLQKRKFTYFITIMVTCLAYPCMNILFSFAYKQAVNAVEFDDYSRFISMCILFFIAIFIQCILEPFSNYKNAIIVNKTLFDLRCKIYEHTTKLPVTYFEENHSGDVILRMSSNVDALEPIYRGSFRDIMQAIYYGIGAFISMIVINYKLAICAVVFSMVAYVANKVFTTSLKQLNDEKQEDNSKLNQTFVTTYDASYTAKIFGRTSMLTKQFKDANQKFKCSMFKTIKKQIKKETLTDVINSSSNVILLIFGLYLVRKGQSDVGSIVAVIALQGGLTAMFISLGGFFANMQGNLANVRRVFELLDEEEEINQYPIPSALVESKDTVIAMDHIEFSYDDKTKALDQIKLEVKENEFVAIVGQNGSGKSTLIKLLLGFYRPKGNISFCQKPFGEYNLSEIREKVAYVPQIPVLFNTSIRENILYGRPNASDEDVENAAKLANIHEFILSLENGYDTLVGENGAFLSGGQKQRIAIARALLKNSPILLLDEATSALDTINEAEVMQAILKIVGKRTILMITHRLATIQQANQIIFMKQGKITETGTHEELIEQNGDYKKLYDLQFLTRREE